MEDEKEPKAERDMKLVELTRVMGPVEAEVIKNFLESQGIVCILQGQMVHAIYPVLVDGLAETKIMVSEKDYPTAKELLESHPPGDSEEK
jgi:hypothetical protein